MKPSISGKAGMLPIQMKSNDTANTISRLRRLQQPITNMLGARELFFLKKKL